LNYSDFETWKLTLAEMAEVVEKFEELSPGILSGFVIRD